MNLIKIVFLFAFLAIVSSSTENVETHPDNNIEQQKQKNELKFTEEGAPEEPHQEVELQKPFKHRKKHIKFNKERKRNHHHEEERNIVHHAHTSKRNNKHGHNKINLDENENRTNKGVRRNHGRRHRHRKTTTTSTTETPETTSAIVEDKF